MITQDLEPLIRVPGSLLTQRVVVDCSWGTRDFAVVCGGVEVDDVEGCFEKRDAGDEGFALDAVFVEVVWVAVGGCD